MKIQFDIGADGINEVRPKAIYKGFSSHDGDAYYQCPVCKGNFSGWSVFHNEINENGTRRYCPLCKTELEGLE